MCVCVCACVRVCVCGSRIENHVSRIEDRGSGFDTEVCPLWLSIPRSQVGSLAIPKNQIGGLAIPKSQVEGLAMPKNQIGGLAAHMGCKRQQNQENIKTMEALIVALRACDLSGIHTNDAETDNAACKED